MKQSESIAKLAVALVAVQREVRGVAKGARNTEFGSQYATLDAIIAEVRPVLAQHGLAVVQGSTTPHTDDKGAVAAVVVESMLVHESGEWLTTSAVMPVVGRMLKGGGRAAVDPQAGGSALTYGRRYGISALLCLSTDEDDDGNRASKQPKARAAKPTGPTMLIGQHKGELIAAQSVETLTGALAWCRMDPKREKDFAQFIVQIETALDEKNNGGGASAPTAASANTGATREVHAATTNAGSF